MQTCVPFACVAPSKAHAAHLCTCDVPNQVKTFHDLQSGDLTSLVESFIPTTSISAPTFFSYPSTGPTDIEQTFDAVSFGFTGVGYSPCAVPITPIGVGIFPQGARLALSSYSHRVQPQSMSSPCLGWCLSGAQQPDGCSASGNLQRSEHGLT